MTKPEGWWHSVAQAGVAVTALPRAVAWTAEALPCWVVGSSWSLRPHFASLPACGTPLGLQVPQISSLLCDAQMEKWHLKGIYSGGSRVRHANKALEWLHRNWSASEKLFIWFLSQTWSSHWAAWFGSAREGQGDRTRGHFDWHGGRIGPEQLGRPRGRDVGKHNRTQNGTQKASADWAGGGEAKARPCPPPSVLEKENA